MVVSLTFDDGLPCQIENALPLMKKYDIQGTFFLIAQDKCFLDKTEIIFNTEAWKEALANGNEIGSHSVSHSKAVDLSSIKMYEEAFNSRKYLENKLNIKVTTYCYPYTDAPEVYQKALISAGYNLARGGRGARFDKYISKNDKNLNLMNVPCHHLNEGRFNHGEVEALVYATMYRKTWVNFMFHGIGKEGSWDNVTFQTFEKFMKFLSEKKAEGLKVLPMAQARKEYFS